MFVGQALDVDMKIDVSAARGHLDRAVVSELLQRADGTMQSLSRARPKRLSAGTRTIRGPQAGCRDSRQATGPKHHLELSKDSLRRRKK